MFEGRRRKRADSGLFGEKSPESTSLFRESSPEGPRQDGTQQTGTTVPGLLLCTELPLGLEGGADARL